MYWTTTSKIISIANAAVVLDVVLQSDNFRRCLNLGMIWHLLIAKAGYVSLISHRTIMQQAINEM